MLDDKLLQSAKQAFERSSKYDLELVKQHSVGGNALYNLETLARHLRLEPGMKVLDLACGKGTSSVFLAKEFGVDVFAVDSEYTATMNQKFFKSMQVGNVLPLQLDARSLPFAERFFDCIIVVNSFTYFGTDDKFLPYITRFLKPGGQLGVADICFRREVDNMADVPEFLQHDFANYWYQVHSLQWWTDKWQKPGLVTIDKAAEVSDTEYEIMKNVYLEYIKETPQEPFGKALSRDSDRFLSFFYIAATRTGKQDDQDDAL